ncbi:MAG: murein L,D-transpeptidase [Phenylobacterium sp.]
MLLPILRRLRCGQSAALATAAVMALSACDKPPPPGAVGGGDVDYALQVLAAAPQEGFAPDAFGARRIADLGRDSGQRAARDQALHAAVIAYARAEHGLSIPAKAMPQDWGLRPPPYDAEADLQQALAQHRFKEWLAALPPATPAYRALRQAYGAYLKIAAAGGWQPLAPGPALHVGARGPAVDALRARLAMEDSSLAPAQPGTAFDPTLADALARFQASHKLQPTGVLDRATLEELNVPAQARAGQIRANLERLRWLPREEPPTRVDVNTAAGLFDYYENGRPVLHMLAASGKPGDESPMLASAIDAIVINPPWNVPQNIAQDELLPKGGDYLASHGFQTVSDGAGGTRLQQKPGAESALGLVKFEFKNPYSVYLHDTPSKAAFNRTDRAVSHGCVRLEKAVDFARLLLTENGWPPEKLDQAIASGETQSVPLHRKVPVRLIYLTAYPQGNGVGFAPDIYGWDAQLLQLLDGAAGLTVAQADKRGSKRAG